MRRVVAVFAVLGAGLTFGSAVAGAQEDGVVVDPAAPTAKEYALPLEAARRELNGRGDEPVDQGARDAPMFGAGVSREQASGSGARTGSAKPRGGTSSDEDVDAGPTGTGGAASGGDGSPAGAGSLDATEPAGSSSGPGSTTVLIGGGGGVLVLTLLGGLALRAVRGPH